MDNVNLMVKFQQYFFLSVGFLLGSVGQLYGNIFNFVLLVFVLILFFTNKRQVYSDWKKERIYIGVNVFFLIYFSLHTVVTLCNGNLIAPPSYGSFEVLILNFVFIPIYIATLREWITPGLMRQFLFAFCFGCLLMNFYIMFSLTGWRLFTSPMESLDFLYSSRFGDNRLVLGAKYWLEMQAMSLVVAALITYLLMILKRGMVKYFYLFMFLSFVIFISFTVTKSAILGFLLGFLIMNVYLFRKFSFLKRIGIVGGVLAILLGFALLMDITKYEERIQQVEDEVASVRSGEFAGTTIAPRVAFIKESFRHFDEFSLWGLGVCTKHRIKAWFDSSNLNIEIYNNVHNAFLQYWIIGGIVGLGVVIFLFAAPLYRMIRQKKFSFLILAVLLVFLIVSNTCVTLSRVNARALILIFLAMFYFYNDIFAHIESDKPTTL